MLLQFSKANQGPTYHTIWLTEKSTMHANVAMVTAILLLEYEVDKLSMR